MGHFFTNTFSTQKRNNDEYQESKADWDKHYQEQLGHPLSATVTDKVYTYGGVSYTNSTTDVTISSNQTVLSKDQLDAEVQKDMAAWAHGSSNYWLIWNPSGTVEITWHNAAQDENGRKLNIVWTLSDIASLGKNVDNWMRGPYITIFNNPMDEIAWGNIAGLRVTENLVYADTEIKYDKPYYRSAGSLDAQPGAERYEFSSPISGVLGSFISSDSYINPTVQSVSGPAAQVASVMFAQSPNHKAFVGSDYDQAALTKFGITYLVNNGSTIAYGTSGTPGSGNGADGGNVVSPYATHIMGNTGLAMQAIYPPVKKTTEIHSHYKGSKISKIVVTYSDSTPTGNRITQSGLNAITEGANDNFLVVFEDPVRGDMHSTTVTATYQYYDANGNLIDFSGTNNAWLSVGSLNFDQGNDYQGGKNEGNPTSGISEGVKLISGAQIKQLAGSSISVHDDGWAYAGFNNYSGTGMNNGINTDNGGSGWDMDGSPNAYYGAIVFQLTGSSVSLRQGLVSWGGADIASQYNNQFLNNAWFTAGTTLPETQIKQPIRKASETYYHYNTKKAKPQTSGFAM